MILHPDTYPAHKREEAERRFKETEAIFEEIKRLRGPSRQWHPLRFSSCSFLRRWIEAVTHLLACPERRNDLLGDGNGFTRARVTACASLALLDREGAEAAKLNSPALCKSITDRVEDRIDDLLDVTLIQMRVLLGELDGPVRI